MMGSVITAHKAIGHTRHHPLGTLLIFIIKFIRLWFADLNLWAKFESTPDITDIRGQLSDWRDDSWFVRR